MALAPRLFPIRPSVYPHFELLPRRLFESTLPLLIMGRITVKRYNSLITFDYNFA